MSLAVMEGYTVPGTPYLLIQFHHPRLEMYFTYLIISVLHLDASWSIVGGFGDLFPLPFIEFNIVKIYDRNTRNLSFELLTFYTIEVILWILIKIPYKKSNLDEIFSQNETSIFFRFLCQSRNWAITDSKIISRCW